MPKFLITIDNTKVTGSSHTNFVYMFTQDTDSIPSGFWDHIGDQVSGLDVRFFSMTQTELSREVVSVDVQNQKIEAWVQIPLLYGSQDTLIWCYYGGYVRPNDTTLWSDIGARGIWHLRTTDESSSYDRSTSNSNATQQLTEGFNTDGCYSFNGSTSYLSTPDSDSLSFGNGTSDSPFTLSFWFNVPTWPASATGGILSKWNASTGNREWLVYHTTSGNINFLMIDSSLVVSIGGYTIKTDYNTDQWYRLTIVYDGSSAPTGITWYLDGSVTTDGDQTDPSYVAMENLDADVEIGSYLGGGPTRYSFNGQLDEVRILASNPSGNLIATEWENQSAPSTFSGAGSEVSSEKITMVSFAAPAGSP